MHARDRSLSVTCVAIKGVRCLALIFLLVMCGQAVAESRLQVAREVAEWRWGNVCNGQVAVFNRPLKDYIAVATWNRPQRDCTITYTTRRRWQWWDLCRATVHEYGHLALGLGDSAHSDNPLSVMFPYTRRPYPPCGPDHKHPAFGSASR